MIWFEPVHTTDTTDVISSEPSGISFNSFISKTTFHNNIVVLFDLKFEKIRLSPVKPNVLWYFKLILTGEGKAKWIIKLQIKICILDSIWKPSYYWWIFFLLFYVVFVNSICHLNYLLMDSYFIHRSFQWFLFYWPFNVKLLLILFMIDRLK